MALEEANTSSFNLELMDDTQDSIDPSLISENCNLFYERGEQGYICKVCDHQYASRRYVLFHLTNSHNIPTHSWPTCDKCGKIFTKPSKLAVHINNHPKMKLDKPSEAPDTPPVTFPCATTSVKIIKSPPTEHHRSKHRTIKPKLLTIYFIRSSLPPTYKPNPHKCGKCFKSFTTSQERDTHRELVHAPVSLISPNSKQGSGKKTKRKLKRIKLVSHKHKYRTSRSVDSIALSGARTPVTPINKKRRRTFGGATHLSSSPKRTYSTTQFIDPDKDLSLFNFIKTTSPPLPDTDMTHSPTFLLNKAEMEEGNV